MVFISSQSDIIIRVVHLALAIQVSVWKRVYSGLGKPMPSKFMSFLLQSPTHLYMVC